MPVGGGVFFVLKYSEIDHMPIAEKVIFVWIIGELNIQTPFDHQQIKYNENHTYTTNLIGNSMILSYI
jgi:hypothetical protein